jgi:hypothetical protein
MTVFASDSAVNLSPGKSLRRMMEARAAGTICSGIATGSAGCFRKAAAPDGDVPQMKDSAVQTVRAACLTRRWNKYLRNIAR